MATAVVTPGSLPIGGGTDLVVRLRDGLDTASRLVDIRGVAAWSAIGGVSDGSAEAVPGALHIGGAVRLQAIADHPLVGERAPALAEAARQVGTPALRAMGTLAGNLCQAPRCWYWRGGHPCRRTDATLPCHALTGESEHHAIFEVEPCAVVHPSDPAAALLALDSVVLVATPDGRERKIPFAELHAAGHGASAEAPLADTTLGPGELVTGVLLPVHTAGTRQRYVKLMQRGAWDFVLVSCAAVATRDGRLRIALGGVAARPWLVPPELLADLRVGEPATHEQTSEVAERLLASATPLPGNRYKLDLVRHLTTDAIAFLTAA